LNLLKGFEANASKLFGMLGFSGNQFDIQSFLRLHAFFPSSLATFNWIDCSERREGCLLQKSCIFALSLSRTADTIRLASR
jgi:hypothetical protein